MKDHEEPRCTLKPPMRLVSATQYPAPKGLRLPVPHKGRIFMRTPEKKLVGMDEATGDVLWQNAAESIGYARVIWNGRLVSDHTKKARAGRSMLDEPIGLALIDVETGRIERAFECDWPQHVLAVGSTLFGHSLGDVLALDLDTGKTIWKWEAPDVDRFVHSSVAVDGRAVYFGLADGAVLALDRKTGRELWRASVADLARDAALHRGLPGGGGRRLKAHAEAEPPPGAGVSASAL